MAGLSGNRILAGAIFFAPVRICPGAQPASYTMATGSLTGVRRPRRDVNQPLSAEVTERVELQLYSSSGECYSVFISYSLHVCYMPYAYAPGLAGTMNHVANKCWKMRWNITGTMQMKEIRSNKQKICKWGYEQRHSYQDKGKNTPEKKPTHKFSTTHYCQINYEVLSLRSERPRFFFFFVSMLNYNLT